MGNPKLAEIALFIDMYVNGLILGQNNMGKDQPTNGPTNGPTNEPTDRWTKSVHLFHATDG
jgi:hypothetical protein